MRRGNGWVMAGLIPWAVMSGPVAASAQEAGGAAMPEVVGALVGDWTGEGELLGRPGAFEMSWGVLERGFATLHFRNAFVGDDGERQPVLEARAHYRFVDGTGTGAWIDDRPQQILIRAVVTDSSLVSEWSAESERGRTEYVVRSPDQVVVRDWVGTPEGERLFGEATYRRVRQGR